VIQLAFACFADQFVLFVLPDHSFHIQWRGTLHITPTVAAIVHIVSHLNRILLRPRAAKLYLQQPFERRRLELLVCQAHEFIPYYVYAIRLGSHLNQFPYNHHRKLLTGEKSKVSAGRVKWSYGIATAGINVADLRRLSRQDAVRIPRLRDPDEYGGENLLHSRGDKI
jgi:hypothetical protein